MGGTLWSSLMKASTGEPLETTHLTRMTSLGSRLPMRPGRSTLRPPQEIIFSSARLTSLAGSASTGPHPPLSLSPSTRNGSTLSLMPTPPTTRTPSPTAASPTIRPSRFKAYPATSAPPSALESSRWDAPRTSPMVSPLSPSAPSRTSPATNTVPSSAHQVQMTHAARQPARASRALASAPTMIKRYHVLGARLRSYTQRSSSTTRWQYLGAYLWMRVVGYHEVMK